MLYQKMETTKAGKSVISSEESFLQSIYQSLWKNRCLSVIVGLKIPEIICSSEESSINIEEIAEKSGCETSKQLYPMMRLLAQWGIGKELENKHFTKNKALELLRRDKGPSVGHVIEYANSEENYSALRNLAACVKHGKPAFVLEHGMTHLQYLYDLERCPYDETKMLEGASVYRMGSDDRRREFADNYSSAMKYMTYLSTLPDVAGINNVFEAFPWSTCSKIVDVGGSSGYFLASILKLPGCEHIQGFVIDLPEAVDEAKKNAESLGIAAEHRIEFIKKDFLNQFPDDLNLQVDTVVLKNVLNIFAEDQKTLTKILSFCRDIFSSQGGRLLVIEYCSLDAGDTNNNVGINGLDYGAGSIHSLNIGATHIFTRSEWIKELNEIGSKLGCYHLQKIHDTFSGGKTIIEFMCKPL